MSMFTRLDANFTRYGLPTIPKTSVQFLSEFEGDAYDHWVFDTGNADGLVGRVAGRVLTAQSDEPTYATNYLTMSNAAGKALLTDVNDSGALVATVFAVVRFPASAYGSPGSIFGSYVSTTGFMASVAQNNAIVAFFRGTTNAMSLAIDPSGNANEWKFVAVSCNLASASKVIRGQANLDYAAADPVTGTYAPTANKIALGNPSYAGASALNFNFAEFGIILGNAYTQAELLSLYNRSKQRMALRGILL